MYHNTKADIYQMFIDGTANETGNENRLATEETEHGTVSLIAYGWQKIAEYHPRHDAVRVFDGHAGISKTTDGYLSEIKQVARENDREVIESGESPIEGDIPDCINYANEYINWSTGLSPVEKKAKSHVQSILKSLY